MLASFAEYDAVPGNSQQGISYQAAREGLHPYAAGHTNPHSVLSPAALTAILAEGGYAYPAWAYTALGGLPAAANGWGRCCPRISIRRSI